MLTTISIIMVLIGLLIIASIILKKFPALAILDVENIPGQKEAKFKEEIIKKRLERDLSKWGQVFVKIWRFLNAITSGPLYKAYTKLKEVKDTYRRSKKLTLSERREHIRNLFRSAEDSLKADDLDKAEASLIEIVSLEQKNLPAFVELADVYSSGKKWAEARQTLGYALKLCKASKEEHFTGDITLQKIYFSLALVNDNLGDFTEALDNVAEALEIEPNNPRYLDLAIELAIQLKNKNYANDLFERLRDVNPENAKLVEIAEQIAILPEAQTEPIETIE
jgi:lipopolysaccharide biosynthesis regulator YciM